MTFFSVVSFRDISNIFSLMWSILPLKWIKNISLTIRSMNRELWEVKSRLSSCNWRKRPKKWQIWANFCFSKLAVTFFLGTAAQIWGCMQSSPLNFASFASRKLLEKSILKVLGGVHFFSFFHFFMCFQFRAALTPSKMSLPNSRCMENDRNFVVNTKKSSDFSLVENPWRDYVFSKGKKFK